MPPVTKLNPEFSSQPKDAEGDEEEEDPEEGDEPDDPDAGKTEAEIRAELVNIRKALKTSNDNGLKERGRRTKLKEAHEKELAARTAAKAPADSADVEARVTAATAAARKTADERIMRSEAKAALIGKGASPERVSKLLALVDYADLEVDDDGEVDGLAGAIDDLVSDWPELFGKGGSRRRIAGDADNNNQKPKPKTATERQVAQLLGK